MKFSGEFHHDLGVTPNNITLEGAELLLRMALQNYSSPLYVGLCNANWASNLQVSDLEEPTIGVNGYSRMPLDLDAASWPTISSNLSSAFAESKPMTWTPAGAGFDKEISRMFICVSPSALIGDVFCLSAALPAPLKITTPFTSTYRIYAR